jgi:carbon starvation protein
MNGLFMLIISVVFLTLAYLLYGRFLARSWGIDPALKTPAQELEDGMEYVPTNPEVTLGRGDGGSAKLSGVLRFKPVAVLLTLLLLLVLGVMVTVSCARMLLGKDTAEA